MLTSEIDPQKIAALIADSEPKAVGRPGEAGDGRAVGHLQYYRAAGLDVAELQFARIVAAGHELGGRVRRHDGQKSRAFLTELQRRLALRALAGERPGGE